MNGSVDAKLVPPQSGPPDRFWQKIAKSGPLAKNGPPLETKFSKHMFAKIGPQAKLRVYTQRMHAY